MNSKGLFVAFVCLFSAFIVYNVAMVALNTFEVLSLKGLAHEVQKGYITISGIEPTGDPIDPPGGWPK